MFDIRTYDGAGPIKFGMTSYQVITIMGQPLSTGAMPSGVFRLLYSSFEIEFDYKGAVCNIGFLPNAIQLIFDDIDIFGDPRAFEKLVQRDGHALENLGIVVLLNLGISVTGFENEDDDKSVGLFSRGYWDTAINDFSPYQGPDNSKQDFETL